MLFGAIGHGMSHYAILTPFSALPLLHAPGWVEGEASAMNPRRGSSVGAFTFSLSEPSKMTSDLSGL